VVMISGSSGTVPVDSTPGMSSGADFLSSEYDRISDDKGNNVPLERTDCVLSQTRQARIALCGRWRSVLRREDLIVLELPKSKW
jgi:hypothetical protein